MFLKPSYVNILVGFKGDVRPSGVEPWATSPSFRWMGLGPCEGNVFEAFLGDPSVLQEGGARALRRESFGAFLGDCFSRFQRRR